MDPRLDGSVRPDADRFHRTTAGPALDRLADLARRLLGTTSAQVSLLHDLQTVAGGAGLPDGAVGSTGALVDSLCTVTASLVAPLVVEDAGNDPRVSALPPVTSGAVASYLGVPLVTGRGEVVGALCAYDPEPRTWGDGDPELLEQLARSVVAELELAALSGEYRSAADRWQLALDAAGVGTFDWDLPGDRLVWDDRMVALFDSTREELTGTIADFDARVHPDDRDRVETALRSALDSCGTFEAEYRVLLRDGGTRWVSARGRALAGVDGAAERLLGAAYDTSEARELEASTARVLESMSAAFYSLDAGWRFTYVNAEAERLLGRTREELLGGVLWELFPLAVGSAFETSYRGAVETGQPVTFDAYYPPPLDGWYEIRAWPGPDGLGVYFLDITERRAAQRRAEAAMARARLVADVTTELSDTLDAEVAVARLAQLLVPELADWCLVTLVDDDGGLRDVGWAHADPARLPEVARYSSLRLDALRPTSYVAQAMRTGQPAVLTSGAAERIGEVLEPGEARDLLLALAPESGAILPMQARGRTVGLLSLFNGPQRGSYDDVDVTTARDVAARAALALDNARLFQQQRLLAEELQRSLLTPPPQPPGTQVAVRYVAAAQAAQVGGDWYDAFVQPCGATVLVIGDVVGHDTAAAAAMGQVRGLLRGVAFTTQEGPASVLTRLDAAMEGLQVATTATAVVARLEQPDGPGSPTRVRWSNAGHPPPMAVGPEGDVLVLSHEDADLLLGIDPDVPRAEHLRGLERGSTVLLYTDGLVERRGQSLDEGLARLASLLGVLAHLPVEQLCDELLARMVPELREDDVALVAVRLLQDQEGPA